MHQDLKTSSAFANSWNHLPEGSVYTIDQFEDWFHPIKKEDISGKNVLELGCGNGSMLTHMANWEPSFLEGVDLGDSVNSARKNMTLSNFKNWKIAQADLNSFRSDGFDFVYCIGVLHHLKNPKKGLNSVIANVKKGGRFHCWVYAREGNAVIIYLVEPLRRLFSQFPWWLTKYFVATPLTVPFYFYAKMINLLKDLTIIRKLPLYEYSLWIAKREFSFFRHVAFDQLVTPQTTYIDKKTIESWLNGYPYIDKKSIYITMRNGNSWKFGGRKKD